LEEGVISMSPDLCEITFKILVNVNYRETVEARMLDIVHEVRGFGVEPNFTMESCGIEEENNE
jgi:hypothetical protein